MLPPTSGSPSIATRWLRGSATVLWIGDDMSAALENRFFQAFRLTPAGIGIRGADLNALPSSSWFNTSAAALGASALLTEKNYSPFPSREIVFNGVTVPTGGLSPVIEARFASCGSAPYLQSSRTDITFGGIDWLAGQAALACRTIVYRNATSSAGVGRNCVRGSTDTTVDKGYGSLLHLTSASPAWLSDDFPVIAPASGESMLVECQSFDGATPTAGSNFVVCCAVLATGATGLTFIPASNAGWSVLDWLNTTKISDNALGGVLPLLGLTDIVISLGQNNPTSQSALQFQASLLQLVARLRTAVPGAAITFIPPWDTNDTGSMTTPWLADFAAAHYNVHLATPNSAFLNLYAAAGPFAQNNGLGFFADPVNPTDAGKLYLLQTLQGLLDQLYADDRPTAAGRYATQRDIEDAFGRENVSLWSRPDGDATTTDIARIQRALDQADAFIDAFFADGPSAVPLTSSSAPAVATLARWSATLAGLSLYQSRPNGGSTGSVSATITASGPVSFSAASGSASTPAGSYAALQATILSEMSRYKSGSRRLTFSPTLAALTDAPSIVE